MKFFNVPETILMQRVIQIKKNLKQNYLTKKKLILSYKTNKINKMINQKK